MNYTSEQKAIFDKCLQLIKNDIHPESYNAWFGKLELYAITNEKIIMIADTPFSIQQLRNRYYTMFYNVVHMKFGRFYELEFYTRDEIERQRGNLTRTTLNPKYRFDNFVTGPSNSFAYAASLAVAEQPSDIYNPLFIYGGVGLGKTHLLNAIGNYITADNPMSNVLLISSETFANEFIDQLLKKKGTSELHNRMRNVDVLMVDDIQFLSKGNAIQEEFFHTFNHLHTNGKQIILSSDRQPKDIPNIADRLRSRFEWGLIVDIQKPDYETRIAILKKKADDEHMDIPYEVIEYIAQRMDSNIRELEGTLTRLNANAELMDEPITLDSARECLSQLVSTSSRKPTAEIIIRTVAQQYGVSEEDMVSKRRSRDISTPRQVAMYLTRELTNLSTTNIGSAFGGRDHTTVMHACDKISGLAKSDYSFKRRMEELKEMVKNS